MAEIKYDLGDPNFTGLHGAGMAGLYMTLQQLEKEGLKGKNSPVGLDWQLSPRQITLFWQNQDREVIYWLLQESFQLDEGRIIFRGLDGKTMDIQAQVVLHESILGTFLQHNQHRKIAGKKTQSFPIEEDKPELIITYSSVASYYHQTFAESLCDSQGNLQSTPIPIAGWLNPGAAVRHSALTKTAFEEPAPLILLLLFAPVACFYFILRSKLRDQRAQYALIIPEVTDLGEFAKVRQQDKLRKLGYRDFHASGLGDAGLKFLVNATTSETAKTYRVKRCQVITMGRVAWATQQKTRTGLSVISADQKACETYEIACDHFPEQILINQKKQESFVKCSFARELIAENLAQNQPWFAGLSSKITSQELFTNLTYERGGLYQMVKQTKWDKPAEELFVKACHEALSFTYGKLSDYAKKRHEDPNFEREATKIRTGLSRCKNAESFREFITNFWSRAGQIPTLQSHWHELLDLISGRHDNDWKKGRDLALLALASYKGKDNYSSDSEENEEVFD